MDVDAQAAPQTHPRLSWQEVIEKLKIQECTKHTFSLTLILHGLLRKYIKQMQGPTINFLFIEFSRDPRAAGLDQKGLEPKASSVRSARELAGSMG